MKKLVLFLIFVMCLVSYLNALTTTWTGVADSDWDNASNWTNGVPDASTSVIIPSSVKSNWWPDFDVAGARTCNDVVNNGTFDISRGTLNTSYGFTGAAGSNTNVSGSGWLQFGNTSGDFTCDGTVSIGDNTGISGNNFIAGPGGTVNQNGGYLSLDGDLNGGGAVNLAGGALYCNNFSGSGTFDLTGGSANVAETYTNGPGGFFRPAPGGQLAAKNFINQGFWQQTGGNVTVSENVTNSGTIEQSGGTVTVTQNIINTPTGRFIETPSGFFMALDFTNQGFWQQTGGDVTVSENVTNSGTIEQSGGTVTVTQNIINTPTGRFIETPSGFFMALDFTNQGFWQQTGGDVTVSQNMSNSGTIDQSGGTVQVNGTLSNPGTYDAGGGTVLYGSTAMSQTIAPSINPYNNLGASGADKVLGGNTYVKGNTDLNGACIDVGNYDLTSYTGQFSYGTYGQDYIITSGTGSLKYGSVSTPSVSSGLFPIGPDASNYNPFYFNNSGVALDWLSARVQPGITPSHPNSPYGLQRTWDINYGPLGSLSANFEFGWNGSQETPLFTTAREAGRIQAHVNHTGSIWETIGSPGSACGPGPAGGYTFQDGPFALVSNFALGDGDHTLPVELSAFNAVYSMDNGLEFVQVNWTTATETDVLGYNVYQSMTHEFEDATKVNTSFILGHGTTTTAHSYSFDDLDADVSLRNYYWIEQTDFSGLSELFGPAVYIPDDNVDPNNDTYAETKVISQYPNPVENEYNLKIEYQLKGSVLEQDAIIHIYNMKGEFIDTVFGQNGKAEIDLSRFATGVYFYRLQDNSLGETHKFVVIR